MINILLATYNGEKYLKEQLDSLFAQTYQDFKILVRDDGSSDKTLLIIKEYLSIYPLKIDLFEDNLGNLGSSKSFMKLLEYSDSEYIMFCDQDDVWLSNKIELSLKKIKSLEIENKENIPLLVFTDLQVVDEKLRIINNSFWKYQKIIPSIAKSWKSILTQNVITGCTIIMNKKAKEVSLPFVLDTMIHDQWIGVNVAKYGKIDYLNEQTILYRQHDKNVAGAYSYGFKYLKYKLKDIKKIISFQLKSSKYFDEVSVIQLFILKVFINIKRLIK